MHGACEILGFDPIYVACEGRFIAFISKKDLKKALQIIKDHKPCKDASVIGEVIKGKNGIVTMKSKIGINRIVDMIIGEQLPRIC